MSTHRRWADDFEDETDFIPALGTCQASSQSHTQPPLSVHASTRRLLTENSSRIYHGSGDSQQNGRRIENSWRRNNTEISQKKDGRIMETFQRMEDRGVETSQRMEDIGVKTSLGMGDRRLETSLKRDDRVMESSRKRDARIMETFQRMEDIGVKTSQRMGDRRIDTSLRRNDRIMESRKRDDRVTENSPRIEDREMETSLRTNEMEISRKRENRTTENSHWREGREIDTSQWRDDRVMETSRETKNRAMDSSRRDTSTRFEEHRPAPTTTEKLEQPSNIETALEAADEIMHYAQTLKRKGNISNSECSAFYDLVLDLRKGIRAAEADYNARSTVEDVLRDFKAEMKGCISLELRTLREEVHTLRDEVDGYQRATLEALEDLRRDSIINRMEKENDIGVIGISRRSGLRTDTKSEEDASSSKEKMSVNDPAEVLISLHKRDILSDSTVTKLQHQINANKTENLVNNFTSPSLAAKDESPSPSLEPKKENPVSCTQSASTETENRMSIRLQRLLRKGTTPAELMRWVDYYVRDPTDASFIRSLTSAVLSVCLVSDANGDCTLDEAFLASTYEYLKKYIANTEERELECLRTGTAIAVILSLPSGIIMNLCQLLCENEVISEHLFKEWYENHSGSYGSLGL